MPADPSEPTDTAVEAFITRWKEFGDAERSNSQSFLKEFCALLSLPQPDPKGPDENLHHYVFEKTVRRHRPDGTVTTGSIDLFRRNCFVPESKQGLTNCGSDILPAASASSLSNPPKLGHGKRGTAAWDLSLERAYSQASGYVKDLSAAEGRPPFVIVCDVGHCFELYSEFTCTASPPAPTFPRQPHPRR